nr:hypothetical protein [uncultured Anaeromusa sp.]
MRKRLRKINWGVAVLWSMLLVLLYNPIVLAEENTADKAYLRDVYKTMASVRSVHYDMAAKGDSPKGDLQLAASGDLQGNPLKFKQDLSFAYHDLLNKETRFEVKQCGEADQENLVVYMLQGDKWLKKTVPIGASLSKVPTEAERAAAQEDMMQYLKLVKTIRETPSYKTLEITMDVMKLSDAMEAAMQQQAQKMVDPKQGEELKKAAALMRIGLLAAGDIKYTVKVDKATKMIKEIEMDLTGPIRKGSSLFLNLAPAKDRGEISDFIQRATLSLQVTYSKFNQIGPVDVPQEARDTAKEIESKGKEALAKPVAK